jgi:hypothetical protein
MIRTRRAALAQVCNGFLRDKRNVFCAEIMLNQTGRSAMIIALEAIKAR